MPPRRREICLRPLRVKHLLGTLCQSVLLLELVHVRLHVVVFGERRECAGQRFLEGVERGATRG